MKSTSENGKDTQKAVNSPGRKSVLNIIIVEDNYFVIQGLKNTFTDHPTLNLIGIAENEAEAIAMLEQHRDVLITDMSLPSDNYGGISIIEQARTKCADIGIIVYSTDGSLNTLAMSLEAGANGYVDKKSGDNMLLLAISSVMDGTPYFCPAMLNRIKAYILETRKALALFLI